MQKNGSFFMFFSSHIQKLKEMTYKSGDVSNMDIKPYLQLRFRLLYCYMSIFEVLVHRFISSYTVNNPMMPWFRGVCRAGKVCANSIPFGILFAYGFNLLNLHIRKIHFPEFFSDVSQEPFFSDAGRPVICILPGKNHTERYWCKLVICCTGTPFHKFVHTFSGCQMPLKPEVQCL